MFDFVIDMERDNIRAKIEELENRYDISMPEVLKTFYLLNNNKPIHTITFSVNEYPISVSKFVPLISAGICFEKIVDQNKNNPFIPNDYYPLARDRGGNYYYWQNESNKVYLLLNDDCDYPIAVANTMEEFFQLLDSEIKVEK